MSRKRANPKDHDYRGGRFEDLEHQAAFPTCDVCEQPKTREELTRFEGLDLCKWCLKERREIGANAQRILSELP
jgi:hypothetical protein